MAESARGRSGNDALIDAIERAKAAEAQLRDALDHSVRAFEAFKQDRLMGVPLPELAQRTVALRAREVRKLTQAAIAQYERAVMVVRATAIQELVNDYAMSFTEVGKTMGISRQMVARLYGAADRKRPKSK